MLKKINSFKYTLTLAIWAILTGYSTLSPTMPSGEIPIAGLDKVAHFVLFGLLAVLTVLSIWEMNQSIKDSVVFGFAAFAIILTGGLVELIQQSVEGRSAEFLDFVANLLGVVICLLALNYFKAKIKQSTLLV